MLVPSNILIEKSLKVGVVYKFCAPEFLNSSIWHYFIVIAIDGDENYLLVCTTQLTNRLNYFAKKNINPGSLAYITPTMNNGLTRDSYIDCNNYFTATKQLLINKYTDGKLQIAGDIDIAEYNNILEAIALSETFDLPKYILVFE